jgi:hypothetical protein
MKIRALECRPKTIPELKTMVEEVWATLGLDTINALVAEMPRRLRQVIENAGHTITKLRNDDN